MDLSGQPFDGHEWLTQVGTRRRSGNFTFHDKPRPWRDPPERAVSWVLGELLPREARRAAFGDLTTHNPGRDAVRHAQVECLRSKGFRVEHDPYRLSPLHVSVYWDGEGDWDDKVGDLLHSCCTEGRA